MLYLYFLYLVFVFVMYSSIVKRSAPSNSSGGALLSAGAVNYFVLRSAAAVNYGSFEACEAALLDFQSLAFYE